MSLPPVEMINITSEDNHVVEINNMSPVTNLALNLKSLTTSLAGTPSRRLSWSNPFPCGSNPRKFLEESSPAVDSPTFQDIPSRKKGKLKFRKSARKVLTSDSDEDKENLVPISCKNSREKISKHDNPFESDSQDSGYSDISLKRFEMSSTDSTPRAKSAIYSDNCENGFGFYQMERNIDDGEIPDMANLLTKPVFSNIEFKVQPKIAIKKGKLPIRRCLSMEMDCSSELQPTDMKMISETGTIIASSSAQMNTSVDFSGAKKCPFKRPDPPSNCSFPMQSKRRKSSPSVQLTSEILPKSAYKFQRSFSETAATIMHAVQKADLQPDLVGDCSRCYALPLVKGQHQDLKCISSQTLIQLFKGEFSDDIKSYTLVDCRYPYEFEGGHIQGALNIYTKEEIMEKFLTEISADSSERNIIIFHCEFSSERAPSLCRFLRRKDREMNGSSYPKLHHPEMYLLDGGYKAFYQDFKEYCQPQNYKPMNHKDHSIDLRHFRAKSKSWGADSKSRYKLKSSSLNEDGTL